METAKFSAVQMQKLEDVAFKQELITVEGKNGIGENFVTSGRIHLNRRNVPIFTDDTIFIEFGKKYELLGDDPIYAPFTLNVERRTCLDDQLIINTIQDENGNVIFKNKLFDSQKEIFEKNHENIKENNKPILFYDSVTKELQKLIGRLVLVDGNCGILANIIGATEMGNPEILILHGPSSRIVKIDKSSVLFIENNDGKTQLIADNSKDDDIQNFYQNRNINENE